MELNSLREKTIFISDYDKFSMLAEHDIAITRFNLDSQTPLKDSFNFNALAKKKQKKQMNKLK